MSALLDLHPDPGHPGVVVAGVHEALDSLGRWTWSWVSTAIS